MISLVLAALLQAAAPNVAAATKGDGLPTGDYERVAWCHGALAAQLELDPIVKVDMEKIEGKAKVAARAKDDAEIEKERRAYMKDYERALSAAEKASPTMIHAKGVAAEQQGYRFWAPTRAKEPIWRMLDWGMWDANDAGCGDAAKRLVTKSQLFGAALKSDDQADAGPAPAASPEAGPARAEVAAPAPVQGAAVAVPADAGAAAVDTATADPTPVPETPKPVVRKSAKVAKTAQKPKTKAPAKANSAEGIRDAIASAKSELDASPTAASADAPQAPAPTPGADTPPLRGPQQP